MDNTLPTLLIINAVPGERDAYRDDLKGEFSFLEATNAAEGVALCQKAKPDCILLDYELPDANGLSTLASLLANCTSPCAIVIATSIDDTAIAVQSLKSGAYDYLLKKDLDVPKLRHALRNALNDVALKQQLQERRAALVARNRELEQALAVAQASRQPAPMTEKGAPTTPRRILVVDDNHDNADSLSIMLDTLGNEVHTAYDGAGAIEKAESVKPDIMLLDIGMPSVNGYDVANYVRRQPWGKSTTLIALTGWGQEKNRLESQTAGFNYHLVKPVHLDMFVKIFADLDAATR